MYPSMTLLSDKYVSQKQSIFNSFFRKFATFTDSTDTTSSRQGIDTNFFGVTRAYSRPLLGATIAPNLVP